jgi:hypothetical protein
MNWTCRLLAVALATVASLSLNVHVQSKPKPPLGPKGLKPSSESEGVCQLQNFWRESSGTGEPYNDADAYDVYSAIIPIVDPNPQTHTWLIRIDTLPILHGSSLSERARGEWQKARGADTALDDYSKVNAKRWLLQRSFTLARPYALVTRDEIKAMFPSKTEGVMEEQWIQLSAVGFNADKTVAVVYMAHFCGEECGDGKPFVLQKHDGKWKVLTWFQCWVS